MRLALTGVVLMALTGAAAAATWTAAVEEDEGGPVLVASAAASNSPDNPSMLRLMCFDMVAVRYDPVIGPESGIPLDTETDLTFTDGSTTVTRHFVYEDMDGMVAAYLPRDDALVDLLIHGTEVSVADADGAFPVRVFPLDGSARAIGRLLSECGR